MKLIVFGATGSIGTQLVDQALEQGHEVTAFVRNTAKLDLTRPRLKAITGDVLNYKDVEAAVGQHDAVISAIGTPALTRNHVRSQGTANIVEAMEKTGVRRLVSLSSMGIGDSRPMLPRLYKYLLVPLLLRQGFAEHELQEKTVRNSKLDWTLVRPGAYNDGPLTGEYRHDIANAVNGNSPKAKISRADVADFMLKQVTDDSYVRRAPWLSY